MVVGYAAWANAMLLTRGRTSDAVAATPTLRTRLRPSNSHRLLNHKFYDIDDDEACDQPAVNDANKQIRHVPGSGWKSDKSPSCNRLAEDVPDFLNVKSRATLIQRTTMDGGYSIDLTFKQCFCNPFAQR